MIPENFIWKPDALDIAIRHELQHHRSHDLQWNLLLEATRLIAGWNPLLRRALERVEELDELACDENLLGRGRIDVKRYARCLFEVAVALTNRDETKLAGTARMATSRTFLKRRIEMTLHKTTTSKMKTIFSAIAIVATTATAAWASEGLIKDRRVSETKASSYAKKLNVPMNKRILKYLNFATGTPRNRFYMRNALKRMKNYRTMIEGKLSIAGLTQDLVALPLMESGYQNTETPTSAGLWQFIPETARKYGLVVDESTDERLDAEKETDAAIKYIAHLQTMFQNDLMLSLLSYNAGEKNANYNAKYVASLIIVNNPSLVSE